MSKWTQLFAATNPAPISHETFGLMVGGSTASGVSVSPESALKLSTVFACVRLLSETIASLPLVVYQRQADGGRSPATNHPLYDVLHEQPNANQTAIEMRQMMTAHAQLRGNGYAKIKAGPRGFADQLIPLHPDRVTPELLSDGSMRYKVRKLDGGTETLDDAQMFHLKGMSMDGQLGMSVVTYARESMGLGLAAEAYGARFFGNGSAPAGVLKSIKTLSPEAAKRVKESWEESHSGHNQHRVAVLEEGLEWQAVGLNNTDSQFLESREFQAEDACRWFGVPPHMVGLTSKATSWGSGIEQMSQGFVTYTLLPWLTRWEQAITRDLILAPLSYFVEHVVAGLLRGVLSERYSAYAIGRTNGWLSTNDIRRFENMNPVRGGDDDYLRPMNMAPTGQAQGGTSGAVVPGAQFIHDAAARVVRKEIAAVGRIARRAGSDSVAWGQGVQDFYAEHAEFVMQTMRLPAGAVGSYVSAQVAELIERGPETMDDWETRRVADLARLALEAA